MRPFFSRVGGKSRMCCRLVALFPEHTVYCEPFVGGGSCFLRKQPSKLEVINDLDRDISDLWSDLKQFGEFIKEYDFTSSREEFDRLKALKSDDPKIRFRRNLFLSKLSFAGNRKNFAPGAAAGVKTLTRDYLKYKERLKNVRISCGDYRAVICMYNTPDTFHFLDPPYETGTAKSCWLYESLDRKALLDTLRSIKGKFLMTYENNADTRNFFKEFEQMHMNTSYSSGNKKSEHLKRSELIVTNFTLSPQ